MTSGVVNIPGCDYALGWSVRHRAKCKGYCGDGYLLLRREGHVIALLIDGLGSGASAQQSANKGLRAARDTPGTDLEHFFESAHAALGAERGAAMGGFALDLPCLKMSWAAIGDVDGALVRNGSGIASMIQKSGTLGVHHSGLHLTTVNLRLGDTVILTSDGIRRVYRDNLISADVETLADHVLHRYGNSNDDNIVLVFRVEQAR